MLAINLYTTRVVLELLGASDFGLYNLVGGVVILFSFIHASIANATQRYFNITIGKDDLSGIQRIFNIVLTIHIYIVAALFLIAEIAGTFLINTYLNIPPSRLVAANIAYQFSILTFSAQILRTPYNCCIVAFEHFKFYAYNSIIEVSLKLLMTFLLFKATFYKLELYSFLMFAISLCVLASYRWYVLKKGFIKTHNLVKNSSDFKEIFGFISWNMLSSTSSTVQKQCNIIAINTFAGLLANAAVGIATQISAGMSTFVSNFQLAFNPQLMKLYAANELTHLRQLIIWTSKLSALLILLFAIPLVLNIQYIIQLWLNQIPAFVVSFSYFTILEAFIASVSSPLSITIHATGKIKKYCIIFSIISLINIPIAYLLLFIGFHPAIIIASQCSVQLAIYVYKFYYLNKFVNIGIWNYIKNAVLPIAYTSVTGFFICYAITYIHPFPTLITIVLQGFVMMIIIGIIGLNHEERLNLYKLLKLDKLHILNA